MIQKAHVVYNKALCRVQRIKMASPMSWKSSQKMKNSKVMKVSNWLKCTFDILNNMLAVVCSVSEAREQGTYFYSSVKDPQKRQITEFYQCLPNNFNWFSSSLKNLKLVIVSIGWFKSVEMKNCSLVFHKVQYLDLCLFPTKNEPNFVPEWNISCHGLKITQKYKIFRRIWTAFLST